MRVRFSLRPPKHMQNSFVYKYYLDALRALAVTFVFLFHLNKDYFSFGFIGVDIFFVISGYVITQSLFQYKFINNEISFLNFYSKRFLRLFPALIVMLFLFLIFYLLFTSWSDFQLQITIKSLFSSVFALSNFYFFNNLDQFDYFLIHDHSIPLIHTWSLSIEEQFYFFYPFILIFIFHFFKKDKNFINILIIFLLSIFLISFLTFISNFKLSHFYLPFGRVWELILGCLLFIFTNNYISKNINKSLVYLLILIGILIIFVNLNNFFLTKEKLLILISVIITSLIIIFNYLIPKLIYENKFINLFGKASYSIYLYHMPTIYFMNIFFTGLNFYFFSIIISIFFSLISFKFIEPIRYNRILLEIFPRIVKFSVVLVLILILSINSFYELKFRNLIYNVIAKTNYFANIYNINKKSISNRILQKWELDVDECINRYESFKRSTYLNCIKSDFKNNDLFFLVGDSYGLHFINTIANIPSIKNLYYARLDNENFKTNDNTDNTFNLLSHYDEIKLKFKKSKTIVVSINYPLKLDSKKLEQFLSKFKENEKIIFIAPYKVMNTDKNCNLGIYNPLDTCRAQIDYDKNIKIIKILEKLKENKNIFIYDFKPKFCKKNICYNYLSVEDKYVFTDAFSHITKEFAEFLSEDFNEFLKKIQKSQ